MAFYTTRHSLCCFFLLLCCLLPAPLGAAQPPVTPAYFPVPEVIQPNIAFWKKVYSKYTTRQLIIHDAWDLTKIYEVHALPAGVSAFSRRGRRMAKQGKHKIKNILLNFSRGRLPSGALEEKVWSSFGPNPTKDAFKKAAYNVRNQVGQADRFRKGVIRSGLYLTHIQKIFAEYELPPQLAYLPHVESSFDYKAYSKVGAAGIWQFMRSTGRMYMKVGYTIDERRDPIRATVAAAKLLRSNYKSLKSWPLAITAYNHGPSGMRRAVRKVGTKDYGVIYKNYKSRSFGFASRNFYSEFLAAQEIANNHEKYFGAITLENPLSYEEHVVDKRTNLNTLIKHLGIKKSTFSDYNLAFRPAAYRYSKRIPKNYKIRLPHNQNKDYGQLLASLPAFSAPTVRGGDWLQVQPGDSLWSLSRQLGVSVGVLMDMNELDSNRIYIGQIIKVPGGGPTLKAAKPSTRVASVTKKKEAPQTPLLQAASLSSPHNRTKTVAELDKRKPRWQGPPPVRQWHGNLAVKAGRVVVAAEETLGHFADWLSVPTQRIRDLNDFSFNRHVRVGERVRIPLTSTTVEAFEEKRMEYHLGLQEDFNSSYHVESVAEYSVKRGDTIWRLCQEEFELPFWLVGVYNTDQDLFKLKPGDVIHYPVVVPRQAS